MYKKSNSLPSILMFNQAAVNSDIDKARYKANVFIEYSQRKLTHRRSRSCRYKWPQNTCLLEIT